MISRKDLERLVNREDSGHPILSVFLDLSVNSDNKRTHRIFLSQKRGELEELDPDGAVGDREVLDSAFDQIDDWLANDFEEENRGAVIYFELGGEWFEALQFPIAVTNRVVIDKRPVIAPLAQVLTSYHHHGVVLLDREHVRILSVYLGTLLNEIEVRGEPYPAAHDVQAGGYSQQRYQRRKQEEAKAFFREFAKQVEEYVRRYEPDDLVVLGTDENVALFREIASERVTDMIVHTGAVGVDDPASEVLARLAPHLQRERERERGEIVEQLLERVRQDYLASGGFQGTLRALQEGKVDTLVLARGSRQAGVRCTRCGFMFAQDPGQCPFDGGDTAPIEDVVEEMVRLAQEQSAEIEFVDPEGIDEIRGAGALLRF